MSRKVLGGMALVVGLALVVAGLLIMFVVVPTMKQFPDDVDTTRIYSGTMPVLLNRSNLEFMHDIDVELVRHFKTEATDGKVALVLEEQSLSSGGQTLAELTKRYAIDRGSMEVATTYPVTWSSQPGFANRQALVLGWPIDTEKKDYVGWSDDYLATVPLTFSGEVRHERSGLTTYYFTSQSEPAPIDPGYVEAMGMPTELSHEQLGAMIQGLDVAPLIKQTFPQIVKMANWPDPVPLVYDYAYTAEYWIEPTTGVLIDTHKVEIRRAGFPEEQMTALAERLSTLPVDTSRINELLPVTVYYLDYSTPDDTVQAAKADAQDAMDSIELYGTIVPATLILIGAALALIGMLVVVR